MKIGDKVVCIDNSPCSVCGKPTGIIKNNIYVIKFVDSNYNNGSKDYKLHLFGFKISCCEGPHGDKEAIGSRRFRLLDEMKEEARQKQKLITGIHKIAEFKY